MTEEKKQTPVKTKAGAVELEENKLDEASGGLLPAFEAAIKFSPIEPAIKFAPGGLQAAIKFSAP